MKATFTISAKFLDSDGIVSKKELAKDVGTMFVLAYIQPYTRKKVTAKQLYKAFKPLALPGTEWLIAVHGNNDYDSFLIITRTK